MDNKLYGYLGLAKTPGDGWVDKVLTSTRPVTDGKGKIVCVPELKDEWCVRHD